ncbi:hypothetical protein [Allorhizocola rhizosphaerae]|uniref:hypothetical protein n=1 Tax=Allorhizocola rhizosphaerae TaxID=1872709 RepID=UPI000E3EA5AE|nr:hypothetical protein [Allorhizocola rhizosphaerae]
MRGIDELERAFTDLAATAPDGVGIMDAVKADAHRIRVRRRILAISATSAVFAAVLVGVPAVVSGLGQRAPDPPATADRRPLQLTVGVAPGSGYEQLFHGMTGTFQYLMMRSGTGKAAEDFSVFRHDPGTFDGSHLQSGERVTVQGRPAYHVNDLPVGTRDVSDLSRTPRPSPTPTLVRKPAVGWQDREGAWVLVVGENGVPAKEALLRLAETVRVGPPRDLVMPFSLGYVPEGLLPQYAGIRDYIADRGDSMLGFGTGAEPPVPMSYYHPPFAAEQQMLTFRALSLQNVKNSGLGPATRIGGYDAWYVTDGGQGWLPPVGGSMLIFEPGNCTIFIRVADRDRIPLSELTRMVEGARFPGCTEGGEWVRPLG